MDSQKLIQSDVFLSLSNELVRIRGKDDMLHLIQSTLKQYIYFDDSFILKYNRNKKTYKAYIFHTKSGRLENAEFEREINMDYHITDDQVTEGSDPRIQIVDNLMADGNKHVSFIHQAGIKEFVSLKLIEGNQMIGLLILLSEKRNAFTPQSLELLRRISYPISIATANIIANEELEKREQEKNLLLSLSNEIAALKNRQDLFKVVNGKIKQLFSVKDLGFAQRDEGGETFSAFLEDLGEEYLNHPEHDQISSAKYSANDPIIMTILNSEDPIMFVVDELVKQPDMPPYVDFWKSAGIKRLLISALRVAGVVVGAVYLIVDDTEIDTDSILFKGVCSQLAVAVSNILANERIRLREVEKTKLLEFSNAVASVRDKKILGKILKQQLNELFSIEDYAIHGLSRDKKTHRPILYDPDVVFAQHPEFLKMLETDTDIHDGVFDKILEADDLVTIDAEEWYDSPNPPIYANAAKSSGLKKLAGIAIRLGSENIGVMNFRRDRINNFAIQRPLFKSICSQIAIALSNIMANDEVSRHLAEIEKYKQQLEQEKIYLKEEIETAHNYSEIIGESTEIRKVFHLVAQVASSDSTVLLLGETGTGKELIARAIHNNSPRKAKLMVKINCAALPANLIESELFGHERGAFTGAVDRRVGKFELANHGTLFLDEIGELPLELQVKLLRALQEKEIERIGGKSTIKTDVRIIAATNRDLEKLMEVGKFRSDLYYRLNIFPIHLPPLRNRKEDIPLLASHFILRYSKKAGKRIITLSNKALQQLIHYNWPGNIRELEHLIERSVLLATGETIKEISLPNQKAVAATPSDLDGFRIQTLDENEKEYILKVLRHVKGKISGEGGAAALLGVPPSTLNSKIKKLGIRREHHG